MARVALVAGNVGADGAVPADGHSLARSDGVGTLKDGASAPRWECHNLSSAWAGK